MKRKQTEFEIEFQHEFLQHLFMMKIYLESHVPRANKQQTPNTMQISQL